MFNDNNLIVGVILEVYGVNNYKVKLPTGDSKKVISSGTVLLQVGDRVYLQQVDDTLGTVLILGKVKSMPLGKEIKTFYV
jgi:hypothetical protein